MRMRLAFGAGFGAGYLLGARAGRQRYDAIVRSVRTLAERPEVQETAGLLQAQASQLVQGAKDRVPIRHGRTPSRVGADGSLP